MLLAVAAAALAVAAAEPSPSETSSRWQLRVGCSSVATRSSSAAASRLSASPRAAHIRISANNLVPDIAGTSGVRSSPSAFAAPVMAAEGPEAVPPLATALLAAGSCCAGAQATPSTAAVAADSSRSVCSSICCHSSIACCHTSSPSLRRLLPLRVGWTRRTSVLRSRSPWNKGESRIRLVVNSAARARAS